MPKIAPVASERRNAERKKAREKEMRQAQHFILRHLPLDALYEAYQSQQQHTMLQKLEALIEDEAKSVRYKKMLYHCYRKQITLFNHSYALELDLPSKQLVTIERDHLEYDRDWLQRSKHAHLVQHKLWRYWHTARQFSEDEIIGNVLISSILFAGVSAPNSLDDILAHLRQGPTIHHLPALDLQVLFLEPLSPHYGDIYQPDTPLRKSRTLVLDRITQLWLTRFLQQAPPVTMNVTAYLSLILVRMGFTGRAADIAKLLACASCHWMQLDSVGLDPALSCCLEEKTNTCGLSFESFQQYLNPVQSSQHVALDKLALSRFPETISTNGSVISASTPTPLNQESIASLKQLHKHLLKTLRFNKDALTALIDDIQHQHLQFLEPAKRICLWLISLLQPNTAQVQQLSGLFGLDTAAWLKYLSYQQHLKKSSVYSYYAKFAEAWLFHSYPYTEDPDFNIHLEDVYSKILAEEQKSSDQKLAILKRFHYFQKMLFQADDFPVYMDLQAAAHPRTRILSSHSLYAVLDLLPRYAMSSQLNPHDAEMLKLIFILAFRTGMRINEILGLRVKDIEGPACTSIWIRPYRSKQHEHTLKTESAERNLPLHILLMPNEHAAFSRYCSSKRISAAKDDFLFSLWNRSERIPAHVVSQVFSHLIKTVLPHGDYSFHTLRHTAANHLALVLTMPYNMVKVFTDYTEADCLRICGHLLRSSTAQDIWYVLAHVLGHITPKETFKSYLHLTFMMAGYRLAQYDPPIPYSTIKTICPDLVLQATSKDIHLSQLSAQLRLKLTTQALRKNNTVRHRQKAATMANQQTNDLCHEHYYPGTAQSSISIQMAVQVIRHCERFHDLDYIAKKLNLPVPFIQQCKANLCKLQTIQNQKGKPRFIRDPHKGLRVLPCLETAEEKSLIYDFCKRLSDYSKDDPRLLYALKIFIQKNNRTESGLIFFLKDIDKLEAFLEVFYPLFPAQYWACDLPNTVSVQYLENFQWLNKINPCNKTPGKFKKSFRIYLKSQKTNKSLSFLKYIIIILIIFNPKVLNRL